MTALFRLENSRTHAEMRQAVDTLIDWLPSGEQSSLRRAFSVWLEDSIMPRVQGGPVDEIPDVKEIRSMLSETIQRWKEEFREEGLRTGMRKGLRTGRREGEAEILIRLLEKRFGKLPESVRPRVRQASQSQLEAWADRILEAQSIDALINGETPG